jgi:hypothetical protein
MECRANKRLWVLAILAPLAIAASCPGQTEGAGKGPAVVTSQTVSLGSLIPDGTGKQPATTIPFRLMIPKNTAVGGYGLKAIVSFTFTPAKAAGGGKSIAASDFGIGVDTVFSTTRPLSSAVVAPGFESDPTNLAGRASAGAANGQATLADLLSGREVIRIGKSSASLIPAGGTDVQVAFKIAIPAKYFTPGSFSGSMTVTVVP